MSVHMSARYPWRPEEGLGSPGRRVRDVVSCHVDAGNGTQVLCKNINALVLVRVSMTGETP